MPTLTSFQLAVKLAKLVVKQWRNPFMLIPFAVKSMFVDMLYHSIPRGRAERVLRAWSRKLRGMTYRFEVWDCDDFATFFKAWANMKAGANWCGIGFGLVFSNEGSIVGHAWNVCLVDNEVWFVEPQLPAMWNPVSNEGTFIAGTDVIVARRGRPTVIDPHRPRYKLVYVFM